MSRVDYRRRIDATISVGGRVHELRGAYVTAWDIREAEAQERDFDRAHVPLWRAFVRATGVDLTYEQFLEQLDWIDLDDGPKDDPVASMQ